MFDPSLNTFDDVYGLVAEAPATISGSGLEAGYRAGGINGGCENCDDEAMNTVNLVMRIIEANPTQIQKVLGLLRTTLFSDAHRMPVEVGGECEGADEGAQTLDGDAFYEGQDIDPGAVWGKHETPDGEMQEEIFGIEGGSVSQKRAEAHAPSAGAKGVDVTIEEAPPLDDWEQTPFEPFTASETPYVDTVGANTSHDYGGEANDTGETLSFAAPLAENIAEQQDDAIAALAAFLD